MTDHPLNDFELIHAYPRSRAIADGKNLLDVTDWASAEARVTARPTHRRVYATWPAWALLSTRPLPCASERVADQMSLLGLALRAPLDGRDFGADAELRLRTGEGFRWFSLRHGSGDGGGGAILALLDGGNAADEPAVAGIGWQR